MLAFHAHNRHAPATYTTPLNSEKPLYINSCVVSDDASHPS
ncbi:hypothetical protein HMPREF3214_00085 [Alloscardovia omnicolens]|nr:hypothetical protein HMPREF3214_00085 [Alloscardovia omnicolens]